MVCLSAHLWARTVESVEVRNWLLMPTKHRGSHSRADTEFKQTGNKSSSDGAAGRGYVFGVVSLYVPCNEVFTDIVCRAG